MRFICCCFFCFFAWESWGTDTQYWPSVGSLLCMALFKMVGAVWSEGMQILDVEKAPVFVCIIKSDLWCLSMNDMNDHDQEKITTNSYRIEKS